MGTWMWQTQVSADKRSKVIMLEWWNNILLPCASLPMLPCSSPGTNSRATCSRREPKGTALCSHAQYLSATMGKGDTRGDNLTRSLLLRCCF